MDNEKSNVNKKNFHLIIKITLAINDKIEKQLFYVYKKPNLYIKTCVFERKCSNMWNYALLGKIIQWEKTIITALYTYTYEYISINNEKVKNREMPCLLLETRKSHTGHL